MANLSKTTQQAINLDMAPPPPPGEHGKKAEPVPEFDYGKLLDDMLVYIEKSVELIQQEQTQLPTAQEVIADAAAMAATADATPYQLNVLNKAHKTAGGPPSKHA